MFRLEKNVRVVGRKINPCDVDYKSKLCMGNIDNSSIHDYGIQKIITFKKQSYK